MKSFRVDKIDCTLFALAVFLIGTAFILNACSQTKTTAALSTPVGQLFCQINTAGGGQLVVGLIDAEASAAAGAAAPVAVLATGVAASVVNADCAAAAASVPGAKAAIAVSPPTTPVANVAIVTATVQPLSVGAKFP